MIKSKTKIAMAIVAALTLGYGTTYAQSVTPVDSQQSNDQQSTDQKAPDVEEARPLETITVTGSLIPQVKKESATPVITITAEHLKARGFGTVSEALQKSSFASGSVRGSQYLWGSTRGAKTLSMFGLKPGYVKYLIDGRPMGNFPQLYGGSGVFNNLSVIPIEMVEHIDILPGGQSSLYGSDAIAGAINVVLKKKIEGPVLSVRYGGYSNGGGESTRAYLADSFNVGKLNILAGVQFENTKPTWAFDRDLTAQSHHPSLPGTPVAARIYLALDPTVWPNGYTFSDPNNCENVGDGFGGTIGVNERPNSGTYCGTHFGSSTYTTLANGSKMNNLYIHSTLDVIEGLQLYSDLLYNFQEQTWNSQGNNSWGTWRSGMTFYDPIRAQYTDLQRVFAPEEIGGYPVNMVKQDENASMLSFGGKGTFGNWDYDLGFTRSDDKIELRNNVSSTNAIDSFFQDRVLGPDLTSTVGADPDGKGVPVYAANYAAFYTPITASDYQSFSEHVSTYGKTWDNILRAQLTNASLFNLPGGDAGLAVVMEAGSQGWSYVPDPGYFNGYIYGLTESQGAGHRSRYAVTSELRLPILEQVTLSASGRYDSYSMSGSGSAASEVNKRVNHDTYTLSLEYRPTESLLLRARYGTAFKMATLADQYSGDSGSYANVTDHYTCTTLGYTGDTLGDCPAVFLQATFFNLTRGNVDLKPVTSKNWNYGVVWAPTADFSASIDYLNIDISNEVGTLSADKIMLDNADCRLGTLDPTTQVCLIALNAVTRDNFGTIDTIYTPKQNMARESVNAITATLNYRLNIGGGSLSFAANHSRQLTHDVQQIPGEPFVDYLTNPRYSTDFKTKSNATVTWSKNDWTGTLYANRLGRSPNYLAQRQNNYTSTDTGYMPAWVTYNASVQYSPTKNLTLSLMANNLFNEMPEIDRTSPSWMVGPYNTDNYNIFGRQLSLGATYKFL